MVPKSPKNLFRTKSGKFNIFSFVQHIGSICDFDDISKYGVSVEKSTWEN